MSRAVDVDQRKMMREATLGFFVLVFLLGILAFTVYAKATGLFTASYNQRVKPASLVEIGDDGKIIMPKPKKELLVPLPDNESNDIVDLESMTRISANELLGIEESPTQLAAATGVGSGSETSTVKSETGDQPILEAIPDRLAANPIVDSGTSTDSQSDLEDLADVLAVEAEEKVARTDALPAASNFPPANGLLTKPSTRTGSNSASDGDEENDIENVDQIPARTAEAESKSDQSTQLGPPPSLYQRLSATGTKSIEELEAAEQSISHLPNALRSNSLSSNSLSANSLSANTDAQQNVLAESQPGLPRSLPSPLGTQFPIDEGVQPASHDEAADSPTYDDKIPPAIDPGNVGAFDSAEVELKGNPSSFIAPPNRLRNSDDETVLKQVPLRGAEATAANKLDLGGKQSVRTPSVGSRAATSQAATSQDVGSQVLDVEDLESGAVDAGATDSPLPTFPSPANLPASPLPTGQLPSAGIPAAEMPLPPSTVELETHTDSVPTTENDADVSIDDPVVSGAASQGAAEKVSSGESKANPEIAPLPVLGAATGKPADITELDGAASAANKPNAVEAKVFSQAEVRKALRMVRLNANETLSDVAKRVYGSPDWAVALFQLNRSRASSSGRFAVGTKILFLPKPMMRFLFADHVPEEQQSIAGSLEESSQVQQVDFQQPQFMTYRTRGGETLFGLSAEYLGQASRFTELLELNQTILQGRWGHLDPLPAGLELRFPQPAK